jgi:hypothetical protein
MKILKYVLSITDRQEIEIPSGAEILKVGLDSMGEICIWALTKQQDVKAMREILIRPTGDEFEMDEYVEYIDSVTRGYFVWHVFLNKR